MATVLTHALVGASLGPFGPRGIPPVRLGLALAAASVLPDADVLGFAAGIPYGHPLGHRGLSHSLAFAAAVGLAGGWALARGAGAPAAAGRRAALLIALATASHGLLDALTDGGRGVGFLLPFHAERYFLPWRPLRVSPLEPAAFLRGRTLEILARELAVVGPAVAALALAAAAARRQRRRRERARHPVPPPGGRDFTET